MRRWCQAPCPAKANGTLAEVEAITVEVADGQYLIFEPVEKTLT
jgi:hypothetical protein